MPIPFLLKTNLYLLHSPFHLGWETPSPVTTCALVYSSDSGLETTQTSWTQWAPSVPGAVSGD